MNKTKNAFVTFLIFAGLFGGYWVISGVSGFVYDYIKKSSSSYSFVQQNNNQDEDNKFVENLNNGAGLTNVTNKISSNLSNRFIASQVMPEDINGSQAQLLDKIDFNNIDAASNNLLDNISIGDVGLVNSIDSSAIHIVQDSSQSISAYWDNYISIGGPILDIVSDTQVMQNMLDNIIGGINTKEMNNIILNFQSVYNGLSVLEVPQSLIKFHKDNLMFFKNFASTLSGLATYKSDPLKAYVLSQYFPTLVESWNKIGGFITKYNIGN